MGLSIDPTLYNLDAILLCRFTIDECRLSCMQAVAPTVHCKVCERCQQEKEATEFVPDKHCVDGLKKRCKLCMVRIRRTSMHETAPDMRVNALRSRGRSTGRHYMCLRSLKYVDGG